MLLTLTGQGQQPGSSQMLDYVTAAFGREVGSRQTVRSSEVSTACTHWGHNILLAVLKMKANFGMQQHSDVAPVGPR